jgi:hypothetical protein
MNLKTKNKAKSHYEKNCPSTAQNVSDNGKQISDQGVKLYSTFDDELDEEYHIVIGEKSIELDPFCYIYL